jgi:hypothetical protein
MNGVDDNPQAPTVQVASGPVEEYLAGVRAALADLPAHEVSEILDDVRVHLADLTEDLDGDPDFAALSARLGTPATYAAELRAAAGYPAPPAAAGPERRDRGTARLALAGLVASTLLVTFGALVGSPEVVLFGALFGLLALPLLGRDGPQVPSVASLTAVLRFRASRPGAGTAAGSVADFLTSLQPAWWVARAFAAAVLVLAVLGVGGVAAALVTLLAAPLSVWVGHRTRRDRRWLWAVVPLNGLAAAVLLTTFSPVALGAGQSTTYASPYQAGLWQDSERQIHDIRPVDAAGNPLTGVYLFDQDGGPIDVSGGSACANYDSKGRFGTGPAGPEHPYPRGTLDYDPNTGDCVLVPPAPLVVAVPSAAPTPRSQATPTRPAAPTALAPPPQSAPSATSTQPPMGPSPAPAGPAAPAPPTG